MSEGRLPRIRGALMADAVGTTLLGQFGTSTTTTFGERFRVTEGGRTGLTALTTALLFCLVFVTVARFLAIPSFCDGSGADYCWILYAVQCHKY